MVLSMLNKAGHRRQQRGQFTMQDKIVTWVVYLMTIHKRTARYLAVCEQGEWDAMELARPGYHHLVRGGIATEVEAEALARHHPTGAIPVTIVQPPLT